MPDRPGHTTADRTQDKPLHTPDLVRARDRAQTPGSCHIACRPQAECASAKTRDAMFNPRSEFPLSVTWTEPCPATAKCGSKPGFDVIFARLSMTC